MASDDVSNNERSQGEPVSVDDSLVSLMEHLGDDIPEENILAEDQLISDEGSNSESDSAIPSLNDIDSILPEFDATNEASPGTEPESFAPSEEINEPSTDEELIIPDPESLQSEDDLQEEASQDDEGYQGTPVLNDAVINDAEPSQFQDYDDESISPPAESVSVSLSRDDNQEEENLEYEEVSQDDVMDNVKNKSQMNWGLLVGLLGGFVLLIAGGGYFIFSTSGELTSTESFVAKKTTPVPLPVSTEKNVVLSSEVKAPSVKKPAITEVLTPASQADQLSTFSEQIARSVQKTQQPKTKASAEIVSSKATDSEKEGGSTLSSNKILLDKIALLTKQVERLKVDQKNIKQSAHAALGESKAIKRQLKVRRDSTTVKPQPVMREQPTYSVIGASDGFAVLTRTTSESSRSITLTTGELVVGYGKITKITRNGCVYSQKGLFAKTKSATCPQ